VAEVNVASEAPKAFSKEKMIKEFTAALAEAGIFTRVVGPDDDETPADLHLLVGVEGEGFGPGKPEFVGSLFSTLLWGYLGPVSWFIENRQYPSSTLVLSVVLRPAGEDGGQDKGREEFRDALPVKGLKLSFIERAETRHWFFNILIPPWLGDGDDKQREASLVARTPVFFADNEPDRIRLSFPASYFNRTLRYLVPDVGRGEVIIVSRQPIEEITVRADGRAPRKLDDPDDVALLAVEEPRKKDEVRLRVAERVVGIGLDARDRYYVVPLQEGEVGFVQVEVPAAPRGTSSRWTIYRAPALSGS
jgi:hypothetical protein